MSTNARAEQHRHDPLVERGADLETHLSWRARPVRVWVGVRVLERVDHAAHELLEATSAVRGPRFDVQPVRAATYMMASIDVGRSGWQFVGSRAVWSGQFPYLRDERRSIDRPPLWRTGPILELFVDHVVSVAAQHQDGDEMHGPAAQPDPLGKVVKIAFVNVNPVFGVEHENPSVGVK
jgi:hypothetical protein